MREFVSSNPGIRSRFTKEVFFPDYDSDDLCLILYQMVSSNGFAIDAKALETAQEIVNRIYECKGDNFGNAREMRTLFEVAVQAQADRLASLEDVSSKGLQLLQKADIETAGRSVAGRLLSSG